MILIRFDQSEPVSQPDPAVAVQAVSHLLEPACRAVQSGSQAGVLLLQISQARGQIRHLLIQLLCGGLPAGALIVVPVPRRFHFLQPGAQLGVHARLRGDFRAQLVFQLGSDFPPGGGFSVKPLLPPYAFVQPVNFAGQVSELPGRKAGDFLKPGQVGVAVLAHILAVEAENRSGWRVVWYIKSARTR